MHLFFNSGLPANKRRMKADIVAGIDFRAQQILNLEKLIYTLQIKGNNVHLEYRNPIFKNQLHDSTLWKMFNNIIDDLK